jgi:hypothetical protein
MREFKMSSRTSGIGGGIAPNGNDRGVEQSAADWQKTLNSSSTQKAVKQYENSGSPYTSLTAKKPLSEAQLAQRRAAAAGAGAAARHQQAIERWGGKPS